MLLLKISVHFQASIQPFTWAVVAGPTFYLSENFELLKCWTNEVPHPSCPISNCSTIQIVDIFFSLVRELACPPYLLNLFFHIFKFFPMFAMIEFAQFLRLCGLVFLLTLLEFLMTEFPRGFYPVYFLLGLRKKDTGKRAGKKCSSKLSQKNPSIYMGKCHLDNSFRKIKLFVIPRKEKRKKVPLFETLEFLNSI